MHKFVQYIQETLFMNKEEKKMRKLEDWMYKICAKSQSRFAQIEVTEGTIIRNGESVKLPEKLSGQAFILTPRDETAKVLILDMDDAQELVNLYRKAIK